MNKKNKGVVGDHIDCWLKQNTYGSESYQATPARPYKGNNLNSVYEF
jgi:hypothetical protein